MGHINENIFIADRFKLPKFIQYAVYLLDFSPVINQIKVNRSFQGCMRHTVCLLEQYRQTYECLYAPKCTQFSMFDQNDASIGLEISISKIKNSGSKILDCQSHFEPNCKYFEILQCARRQLF